MAVPGRGDAQLLGDGDRAVAAAGAAHGDGGVGLPLALEALHATAAADARRRPGTHWSRDRRARSARPPRPRPTARTGRDEERIGQEANVEHDVGLRRNAVLEPERQQRHRQLALAAAVALLDQGPQARGRSARPCRSTALASCAQAGQRAPLGGDAGADVGVRQRVAAARLGEPPQSGSRRTRPETAPRPCARLRAGRRRSNAHPSRKLPLRASMPSAERSTSGRLASSSIELRDERQRAGCRRRRSPRSSSARSAVDLPAPDTPVTTTIHGRLIRRRPASGARARRRGRGRVAPGIRAPSGDRAPGAGGCAPRPRSAS